MLSCFLNRRTGHVAIGAEHATVPRLRLQERAAARAFIEELTSVGRHCLSRLITARRTRDGRGARNEEPGRMVRALRWSPALVSLRQPLHQHGFGALPDPELHAVALTEHFGGAADALQRNIVVAPRVAQTELAETIRDTLIGDLIAHSGLRAFPV